MKYTISLLGALLVTVSVLSQITINTENAGASLFLTDGGSSVATTNSTNTITALQASDDVAIDNSGNVALGVLAPTTKVDVKSDAPEAIRIADTGEGRFKALMSNADGVGSWSSVGGLWYAFLSKSPSDVKTELIIKRIDNYQDNFISEAGVGSANKTTGTIKVPYTGTYRLIIGGYMAYTRTGVSPVPDFCVGILRLYKNGSNFYMFSTVTRPRWGLDQVYYKIAKLNAGDELSLYGDASSTLFGARHDNYRFLVEFLHE